MHKDVEKAFGVYEHIYKKSSKKVCLSKICVDVGENVLYNISIARDKRRTYRSYACGVRRNRALYKLFMYEWRDLS